MSLTTGFEAAAYALPPSTRVWKTAPMAVLLNPSSYGTSPEAWLEAFRAELPDDEIVLWPDSPPERDVEFVIAVRHPVAELNQYPNLRAVLAMGAGIEQYTDAAMPDVPVVRLDESSMSDEMAAYVIHWIVHFQKRLDMYLEHQRSAQWRPEPYVPAEEFPVAILGFGNIGQRIGRAVHDLGFPVKSWSRTAQSLDWSDHYFGTDGLDAALSGSQAVVNVLPATDATRHLMNDERFGQCHAGALFINLGRGATVDEAALLRALDSGRIGAAVLDVTDPEPMPAENPLWRHPRARITPHIAGYTKVGPASRAIAANIRRIRAGEQPFPVVERDRQY